MFKYNLIGQRGIAGERNPDPNLTDDVATYMYDFPPGQGDNKGATSTNKPVAKKEVEEKKVEVALENPNSYIARKPEVEKEVIKKEETEVKDPGFSQKRISTSKLPTQSFKIIDDAINTVQDLQDYAGAINFTLSQKFYLAEKLNIPVKEIDKVIEQKGQGPKQSEASPIAQLQFETNYIRNFVNNKKKILEEKEAGRDTRSLEQKETDYIKTFVETGVLGPVDFKQDVEKLIPTYGTDINYNEQLNQETEAIKKFVEEKVNQGITENKSNDEIVNSIVEESQNISEPGDGGPGDGGPGDGGPVGDTMSTKYNQFNNIPEGALLVQTDADKLYLMYEVPGQGTLFQGRPIWIFYEVKNNDLYEAGILTPGAPYEINMMLTEEQIDGFVYGGNTADLPGNDPRTGRAPHPFTSFVENVSTQAQIAPWILDIDSVKLLAEAALEGREVTEAEWRMTNWYQTHSEAERDWQRLYYADPTTAQNTVNDYKIQVSRALQAAGVTGGFDAETGVERAVPDALAGWIANKWVSGQWTESYTTEQLALFADPFRSGVRDVELGNYIATAGVEGLERTAEKEDRVRQLYTQWLGPVFGKLTDEEVAQKAGRLRNDPDYEQALVEQLKNNRLALFPQYTNAELTYNDIVTPWRNLTTSVWGKAADETQSWWQDMVATNNFTQGAATLRSKGLEQNVDQVTIEATEALQRALGEGSQAADLGVNR